MTPKSEEIQKQLENMKKALDTGLGFMEELIIQHATMGHKSRFMIDCGVDMNMMMDTIGGERMKLVDYIKSRDEESIKLIVDKQRLLSIREKIDRLIEIQIKKTGLALSDDDVLLLELLPELISYIVAIYEVNKNNRIFLETCLLISHQNKTQ